MEKIILTFILIPLSALLTLVARFNSSFAEFYAVKIYPIFAESISFITSKIKFSLAEFIIIALVVGLIIYLSITISETITKKSIIYFKGFIINLLLASSIVLFLFTLFCGINYYRYEFTNYSGLEIRKSTKEELIYFCKILIKDANETRKELDTYNSTAILLADYYTTAEKAKNAFQHVSEKYPVLEGNYPPPKPVTFSKIMSHMRIAGVFFPFTFEANVNKDIPSYQLPSTMLHELVHLRGFMREDEANFISYLACINSGYKDFAYSGTMLALSYAMNALYSEDVEAYRNLYSTYSDDVKNDLKFSYDYWKQFETKIADISSKVNDSYLKANNQVDGVKSYGRMVDLLLAYYIK